MRIRSGNQILALSVGAALAFWLVDAGLDYWLYDEASFLDILLFDQAEISFRLLAPAGFMIFGFFLARAFERQRRTEDRLQAEVRERRWAEEALLESEEKYRSLVESTEDSIYVVDRDCRYLFMNKKHLSRLDETIQGILGHRYAEFHTQQETASFTKHVETVFQQGESVQREHKSLRDGNYFLQTLSPVKNSEGMVSSVTTVSKLITERKLMENRLRVMSFSDELTGLYNRRGFFAMAEQQLKMAVRANTPLYLLYADLDNLKEINDTHGHHEGDYALIEIGKLLKETFRESDIIARIGGDEFVAVPVGHSEEGARAVVERLKQNLAEINETNGRPYDLSISVGIPCFDPKKPVEVDRLLGLGDDLMYEEKRKKKRARTAAQAAGQTIGAKR